jgi:hypothetical protein
VDDVRIEFHPDMDHMLTSQASQRKMIGICSGWAAEAIAQLPRRGA